MSVNRSIGLRWKLGWILGGVALPLALILASAPAQSSSHSSDRGSDKKTPTRVVMIVLDQLRPEFIDAFDMDNVQALMEDGTSFATTPASATWRRRL